MPRLARTASHAPPRTHRLARTGASLTGGAFWSVDIELGQLCPSHRSLAHSLSLRQGELAAPYVRRVLWG